MLADITFLDLLKMVYEDTQPSEVTINKDVYKWIPVRKDYINVASGYTLGAEIQKVIPFEVSSLVSKKIINYDREILTEEERDYLNSVISPYIDIVESIQKIPLETQKEDSDCRIVIQFNDGNPNLLLPSFTVNSEQYKNMRTGQKYTLEELKLYNGQSTNS